ncbi:MAG: peptidylprolyl isomerase [Phycisphaerae bacterium]|nr:peptidylprolyl isomerase [Phycisphaerae bacterium]
MKRKNEILLAVGVAALLVVGCEDQTARKGKFTQEEMEKIPFAHRENLPVPSDGLTLSVKNETITVDEIITPVMQVFRPTAGTEADLFRVRARPLVREAVIGKITDILLYQEARKQAPEKIDDMLETAVEKEIKRFLAGYGNNYAEAQKALAERGMDWTKFREFQKKLLLTQSYYASHNLMEDRPISHSEMLASYEAMQNDHFQFKGFLRREDVKWDGYVQFRLIDIVPGRLGFEEIQAAGGSQQAALAKAGALLEQIKNGADFAELATLHSHGHRAADGGLWTPVSEGSRLVSTYAPVLAAAQKMEIGQVAGPIESDGHIFLVKVEDKKVGGVAAFADIQARIEMDIQMVRRRERFEKLISKLIEQADVAGLDPFVDWCTEKAWVRWRSEQGLAGN